MDITMNAWGIFIELSPIVVIAITISMATIAIAIIVKKGV